ncbi:MAG: helix-turn-helix transcriptional regulator [Mangrovibacterium sp.]
MDNKLKVYRAMSDITQEDRAVAVNVSRQTSHAIKRKKFVPSTLLALKLARYFNVTVEEIFHLEEND